MKAEKCPNCGAFLPVRRPGVVVRQCEFCDLELPGDVPVVEVEALTARSTWLPPAPRVGPLPERGAPRRAARWPWAVALGVAALGAVVWATTAKAPPPPASGPATAEAPEPAVDVPPALPAPPAAQVALQEAVAAAGGTTALDPLALLPFIDGQVRAVAPDAVLLLINCFPLGGDGKVDLTLTSDARCSYELRAPSRVKRPDDVPAGVDFEVPCLLSFTVDRELRSFTPTEHRWDLAHCHMHHAVRPPRCTVAEVRERALAAGLPADAVWRLRFGGRYRSGYDPIDPEERPDDVERGRWSVSVQGDDGHDRRFETRDDCGDPPPTADERAVLAALDRARPALRRCFTGAVGSHASIEALELIWRLTIDARGAVTIVFDDPGVDIEGMFQGDLGAVRSSWSTCANAAARKLRLPAALGEVRLELRLARDGALVVEPPPFE